MGTDSSGEFHRIRRLPPYVFAEVNTAKARARAAGEDIIDLGMGNPDSATPPHIVAKLEYLHNQEYGGVPSFRDDIFTSSLVLSF